MLEIQRKKKDPIVIAMVDALMIISPLVLFLFVLLLHGDIDSILYKAEWSFVTTIFLVEALRDQVKRQRSESFHEDQTEAGIVFYSIVLSLGVLVLFADFRYTLERSPLPEAVFFTIKFSMFAASAVLFLFHRISKYKHQSNE